MHASRNAKAERKSSWLAVRLLIRIVATTIYYATARSHRLNLCEATR
jgi:hypothetical protein